MATRRGNVRAAELAESLGAQWRGDPALSISGVATLADAGSDELAYLNDPRYRPDAASTGAGAILVSIEDAALFADRAIAVERPDHAFREVVLRYFTPPPVEPGIDSSASVAPGARVDDTATIGPFASVGPRARVGAGVALGAGARIGSDVSIGENSVVCENAVVGDGVTIGARVRIGSGSAVGGVGFGFLEPSGDETSRVRIPHVGTVMIEDDVEIGANCTVDRAPLGATRIGRSTKIDSQVHVGHGVEIGRNVVIVAQCGISGSVVIGDDVVIGGQAGISDHVTIAPGVRIASRSAVMKSIPTAGVTVAGSPARPLVGTRRADALVRTLPELVARVRRLEVALGQASGDSADP